tara:strand:- start:741 stop:1196 length:456 start_codon:yes stop_codon:yes gene_type:complete
MPYRALTHNRVKSFITSNNATTQSQATAINSQNGVGNNGPPQVMKNNLHIPSKQSRASNYTRTLSTNFLMNPNAYGNGTKVIGGVKYSAFVPGQGKGFPNATPQTSVGSTNAFSRRAIARRAVTTLVNNGEKKDCACVPQQVKNLRGTFLN